MIKIFKSESKVAYAIYHRTTKKFIYGELCTVDRLRQILNSFPKHDAELFIEKSSQEDLEELYYLIPQLQELAKVTLMRKVNPEAMLINASRVKKKRPYTLIKLGLGVMLGLALLIPTSQEYKLSVLSQAEAVERFTAEFAENQPNWNSVSMLYSSVESLYKEVRVESIKYTTTEYTIVFSSAKKDLTLADFDQFKSATLTNVSTVKSQEGEAVYIYQLEGAL